MGAISAMAARADGEERETLEREDEQTKWRGTRPSGFLERGTSLSGAHGARVVRWCASCSLDAERTVDAGGRKIGQKYGLLE